MTLCRFALGVSMTIGLVVAFGCSSTNAVNAPGDPGSPTADGSAAADGRAGDSGSAPVCGPFADGGSPPADAGATSPMTTFFVTSDKSSTGNLGGLTGADARCQTLATAVGLGDKTWHAYLSVEHDTTKPSSGPTNAADRIGSGPWYNARGVMVAANLAELHGRAGDPAVFVDERGNMIPGHWTGTPPAVEHDILTGSNADGTLAPGKTCLDWTSAASAVDGGVPDGGELMVARVGHTDGLGPACSMAMSPTNFTSWNSSHDNAGCNDTAPRGGAGRIYCFSVN